MIHSVFADGGVILRNPSIHGGTYAFVTVDEHDERIDDCSGVVTPAQAGLPTITNNFTELYAAVEAMLHLPEQWDGHLFTDSFVTLCRITGKNPGMAGIPNDLAGRMWHARKRLGSFKAILLDGHPTKAQLLAGRGKRGNLCSKWNVLADQLCGQRAKEWLEQVPDSVLVDAGTIASTKTDNVA